jgi:molybdopterin-guanine dinucleotide biosynthesis protein B
MALEIIGVASRKSKSGKTTVVENLVAELKKRGLRVGTLKHIPKDDFTIDREGTDTWKHARAGADMVVALSKNEAAYMVPTEREQSLEEVVRNIEAIKELDYLIVEGFKKAHMPRVVVALSVEDARALMDNNTIAVSGLVAAEDNVVLDVPIIDARTDISKLADLIDRPEMRLRRIRQRLPGLDCGECGYPDCDTMGERILEGDSNFIDCVVISTGKPVSIRVGEREVPMGRFVQDFVKNTVMAMVGTLKGAEMAPGDVLEIRISIKEDDL